MTALHNPQLDAAVARIRHHDKMQRRILARDTGRKSDVVMVKPKREAYPGIPSAMIGTLSLREFHDHMRAAAQWDWTPHRPRPTRPARTRPSDRPKRRALARIRHQAEVAAQQQIEKELRALGVSWKRVVAGAHVLKISATDHGLLLLKSLLDQVTAEAPIND